MQDKIDAIVEELGKQRERECPDALENWHNSKGEHFPCHGTGKVTNPQAEEAWAVMTRPVEGRPEYWRGHWFLAGQGHRIPHDTSEWPEVKVSALLVLAAEKMGWYWGSDMVFKGFPQAMANDFLNSLKAKAPA